MPPRTDLYVAIAEPTGYIRVAGYSTAAPRLALPGTPQTLDVQVHRPDSAAVYILADALDDGRLAVDLSDRFADRVLDLAAGVPVAITLPDLLTWVIREISPKD